MTIWLLAILLLGFFAWTGFTKGAIRVTVMLAGLILAAALALPLAPYIKSLFPLAGITSPYWLWMLPPITMFLLIQLVFTAAAFALHHQVALKFKYRTDDFHRLRWERLNGRLGLAIGLVAACVYLVVIGMVVYVAGYLTIQVSPGESEPATLRILNAARADLRVTGLDKTLAKLDPTPPGFYEACDIAGLVYRNPLLQSRLSGYPGLLPLQERSELQELAADKEFTELFQQQAPLTAVLNHPKIQAIARNNEIVQAISSIDLQDLRVYLETGRSPKFEEEHILGRWRLDLSGTLIELKKELSSLTASGWKVAKRALTMAEMTLSAMPDNRVLVKMTSKDEILKLTQPAAPASAAAAGDGDGGGGPRPGPGFSPSSLAARADPAFDAQFQARYGRRPIPGQGTQPPVQAAPAAVAGAAPAPPPNPVSKLVVSGEGSWQREGDRYKLTVKDTKDHVLEGFVRSDTLVLKKDGLTLKFERD
jgi:hypothetical protein